MTYQSADVHRHKVIREGGLGQGRGVSILPHLRETVVGVLLRRRPHSKNARKNISRRGASEVINPRSRLRDGRQPERAHTPYSYAKTHTATYEQR